MALSLKPKDLQEYKWHLFKIDPTSSDSSDRPSDDTGYEALEELRQGFSRGKREVIKYVEDQESSEGEYQYYGAVLASKTCIDCHYHMTQTTTAEGGLRKVKKGEMIGVVKIALPLQQARSSMHGINAFVITAELIKVLLSMVGIYLVVRYVITKPVLHLKKVSDAIAHGNLDMRADIRTGDEFEELSHAFNRMLRHLVTVQEELREVNADLDGKVDELAQVNLRLYELNNLKNEFLATMSHELRTPLNSILGFSEVLSDSPKLNAKQKRYVSNIQISGKNLMALVNDVLDLAKIESGKMELHIVEFSMNDLVERQVGSMMPMAAKKNIEFTWSVDREVPVLVQDVGKLQQILNNLLSNSIKFTPEGGRVRVRSQLFDEQTFDLIVEDNGVGIPLEEQDTIFEKFRQGKTIPGQKDAITRQFEGSGLGLSIVKELTVLLGGEVLLESEFGKGSTFTVRFPTCLEARPPSLDEEISSQTVGLDRFRPKELGAERGRSGVSLKANQPG